MHICRWKILNAFIEKIERDVRESLPLNKSKLNETASGLKMELILYIIIPGKENILCDNLWNNFLWFRTTCRELF